MEAHWACNLTLLSPCYLNSCFFLNSVEVVYELEIEDEMSHLVAKENKML